MQKFGNGRRGRQLIAAEIVAAAIAHDPPPGMPFLVARFPKRQCLNQLEELRFLRGSEKTRLVGKALGQSRRWRKQFTLRHERSMRAPGIDLDPARAGTRFHTAGHHARNWMTLADLTCRSCPYALAIRRQDKMPEWSCS